MGEVVTPNNLGPEFDIGTIQGSKIRLKLGSGLSILPDGTIVASLAALNTAQVDQSFLAAADIDVQDINDNGVIDITSLRTDSGWSFAANSFTYTGSPDHVDISAMCKNLDPGGASRVRANPTMSLQKLIGGAWVTQVESATGYIRDGTGHTESSNTISYTDESPGVNPQYRLLSRQESTEGDSVNSSLGKFSLKAIEKVDVLIP